MVVVGVGLIGRKHAALINKLDTCSLVGICDTDPSCQSIADELGVPFYQDVELLLRQEAPDGAAVATPNGMHAEVAEICAKHSVHMLIEKPVASTLEQALRILRVTADSGVRVLVAHHRRHNPLVRHTRSLIQGGEIGRLIAVSVLWTLLKPGDYFKVDWRCKRPNGGITLINLIHDIDNLRFICGEIEEVYARSGSSVRNLDVEDSVNVSLSFECGAVGSILASDTTPAPWSYEMTSGENPDYFHVRENCYHFLGTDGSLGFPRMELWRYTDRDRSGWGHVLEKSCRDVDHSDPLTLQMQHFCRLVRGDEAPVVDVRDATQSLAVALAVLESIERCIPIKVPQIQ
jgi:predicted dehydrogenase